MKTRRVVLVGVLVMVIGLGASTGFWMPRDDDFFALRKNFEIFGATYEALVGDYVDPLDPQKMMRTGMDAMLHELDPYTVFFDEADNADMEIITRGRYGGVGLNVQVRNGRITVSSPVENASGYRQGVRAGDIITQVAGKSIADYSLSDVQNLMHGEPGTVVEIVIEREGEPEPLHFLLTREDVTVKNVVYSGFVGGDSTAGIGYVKLARFAHGATQEVRQSLETLQQKSPLQGVILDLRDNPGGLLDAAVEISQLFLPQGSLIVSTKGRGPDTEQVYRGAAPPMLPDTPLVLLINEYSASASEIVAGAVQDMDRGVIVGVPSFGKGLVQVVRPLPYNTSLKLTIAKYYIPSGRSIQAIDYSRHDGVFTPIPDSLRQVFKTSKGRLVKDGRGIEPDVLASPGEASELEQALQRRAAFFFFANHYAATHKDLTTIPRDMTAIYATFQQWLKTQQFSYATQAERSVDQLGQSLQTIGYARTSDEIASLRQAIAEEKAQDFERHAERLQRLLRAEIIARYVTESQQVEALLDDDPQFQKALALLQDANAYAQTLRP